MDQAVIILAVVTFIFSFASLLEFIVGFRSIKNLTDQSIYPSFPSVSLVFSALNEEAHIEAAVQSFLRIDYPNLEIIAINDRSNDKTAAILNALQERNPSLRVHHITTLPEGWFGKNHALAVGSQMAKGDWLLFTDADVLMQPDALQKAMSYVQERKLDHLTICEHHLRNTFWLKVLLLAHYVTYSLSFRPWRIRYRWSKRSLGHGAFNLVNKSVYEKCGTHKAIALECLDDLKLGQLIKSQGYRQDSVDGRDYIEREWYLSLRHMIHGLAKNSFAFFNYSYTKLVINTIFALLFFLAPVVLVFVESGWARWLNLANIGLMLMISLLMCQHFRLAYRYAFLYPISIVLLLYTIWHSAMLIYWNKGVVWRGTHYSLDKLRRSA